MSATEGYQVVMPKLGLIMTEAKLSEWYKKEGEWVKFGQPLFALESEKSTLDIEAPAEGFVNILVPAGDTVPVMTPVALILGDKNASKTVQVEAKAVPSIADKKRMIPRSSTIPAERTAAVRATPKARKLARQRGLNLAGIQGSGPRQMVVAADLDRIDFSAGGNATPVALRMATDFGLHLDEISGSGPGGRVTRADVSAKVASIVARSSSRQDEQPIPLEGLRGIIAQRLTKSWQERPQVTLTAEADATELIRLRQQLQERAGKKVSFNTFFMAALAQVLEERPQVNVQLGSEGLISLPEINIGLAVDTDRGLLVPVVRNANKKSLMELDGELMELAQRAVSGRLLPDELTGGSMTVTNLGRFGIDAFTPIINPPEIAVLGIGRIAARPFAIGRELEVRDTVVLSLSFDHRLIDGAPAARFLQDIVERIEMPSSLTEVDHGAE